MMNRKIAPKSSAPNAARIGLHWAKMTSPMAIQPRPLTVWSPNQPGEARAEEGEGQAGDDLVGPQRDRHHAMNEAEQAAGQHRDQDPEPRIAGGHAGGETRHCPEQHHPLNAEVEDAGPLGEDLADRREEQDGAAGNTRGEDVGEIHQAVARRRSKRIR